MFGSGLIVFREVFEAALVIGIVLAASQGIPRRYLLVSCGGALGVLGAVIVAFFAETIASLVEGMGQELFNASVLFLAVAMLGWHNTWMAKHGRELAAKMNAVGRQVRAGHQPLYAILLVVALAILREGSEVVLFLYGIAAGGSETGTMLTGGLLGLAAGIVVGVSLYLGLLRIPTRYLFNVTSGIILLLAAGMASPGAAFLTQAHWIPELSPMLWDTSGVLPESSALGDLLHTLIGYNERPTGIQLVFYIGALMVIGIAMRTFGRPPAKTLLTQRTT
jgi:high-affinity iron transporter